MYEPKENIRILHGFLLKNTDRINDRGGHSSPPKMPAFELNARDFLDYAEVDLGKRDNQSIVNCVSNLKRAIDCQVDTFFFVYNLRKGFEKRGLGLDKRLDFLHEAGVFSSRTLSRIGEMRNKLEHEYKMPTILDAELYFDLISAFVAVLERTISGVWVGSHEFYMGGDYSEYLSLEYEIEKPAINASIKTDGKTVKFQATMKDPKYFAYLFRVYILVTQYQSHVSRKRLVMQLREANVS